MWIYFPKLFHLSGGFIFILWVHWCCLQTRSISLTHTSCVTRPRWVNWPNSQIPECTCSISHNYPFRAEICTCPLLQWLWWRNGVFLFKHQSLYTKSANLPGILFCGQWVVCSWHLSNNVYIFEIEMFFFFFIKIHFTHTHICMRNRQWTHWRKHMILSICTHCL